MKSINDIEKTEAHEFIKNHIESKGYTFVNAFDLYHSQEFLGHKECCFNFINNSGREVGGVMTFWLDSSGNLNGYQRK